MLDFMGFAEDGHHRSGDSAVVLLRLSDQTWLKFTAERVGRRQSRLLAVLLSILGFAPGDVSAWPVRRRDQSDRYRCKRSAHDRKRPQRDQNRRAVIQQDTGAAVQIDDHPRLVIACRPAAVRRALGNLIDNALIYGQEAAVCLSETDDGVAIDIADRGPGIPASEHEEVFAPFYRRESSRNRQTGGTGLGLTVARTIARRHGGDVTLLDRPGGGLIVRFVLPRSDTANL